MTSCVDWLVFSAEICIPWVERIGFTNLRSLTGCGQVVEEMSDATDRRVLKGPYGWRAGSRPAQRVDAEQRSLAQILNLVRAGDANTKLEIERISGLGRAIVADRLATLLELGLIEEGDLGQANGGRAPRVVRFHDQVGVFLVAVLNQSTIGIALSDLSGKLIVEHHEAADTVSDPAQVIRRLATLFDWALEQHREGRDVWGIGIAVAGPVEPSESQPFTSPNLHFLPTWINVPFVEELVARYGAPVWVRNSTQMTTLGEQRAGSAAGAYDMLFVELGREITAGIVCDGQLYRGAQGGAGLIGHISTGEDNSTVCRCGNTGCLEAVAGSEAIGRAAMRAVHDGQSPYLTELLAANGELVLADVATAAIVGDQFSAELLARSGRLIGTALASLTNSFNPSLIVLGGALAQHSDILLAAIREAVYRRSHPLVTRDLKIVRSQMSSSATLAGVAFSVVDETFASHSLAAWVSHGSPLKHPDVAGIVARTRQAESPAHSRPAPPAAVTSAGPR